METGTDNLSSTPEEKEKKDSSLLTPVLMILGIILTTLSIIVGGYIHGNMHIEAVWKTLHA
jgi:hypothetical protein